MQSSPVQKGIQKAKERGGDTRGFQARATYGPAATFPLALHERLQYETLPPCDWKTVAKACLWGVGGGVGEGGDCYGKVAGMISVSSK